MTQPPPPPPQAAPNSHLVLGILTTLFCCLPLGVVSIVKAAQVNGLWAQGRYAEAQASSAAAKKWAIWSVVATILLYIVIGILVATGVIAADFDTSTTTEY